jgi:S-DNA-T family DNA segregation ATPase FtsK/SpoIIIE
MKKLRLILAGAAEPVALSVVADPSATIAAIAAAIVGPSSPSGTPSTLRVVETGTVLDGSLALADSYLPSGSTIEIVTASPSQTAASRPVLILDVVEGPDAGAHHSLGEGTYYVGRSPKADVHLRDAYVSKVHARIDVSSSSAQIVDRNSVHGITVGGQLVGRLQLTNGQVFSLGDTAVRVTVLGDGYAASSTARGGTVPHNRSPRIEVRYASREFEAPAIPSEQQNQPFPWIAAIAPLILGGVMFAINPSGLSIAFVLLSPILIISNSLSGRANRRRKARLDAQRFSTRLESLDADLRAALVEERETRLKEQPSTAEIARDAERLGPLLWTRRPEHWTFLRVRLGLADQPSRSSVTAKGRDAGLPEFIDRVDEVVKRYATVQSVPVSESLFDAGTLGIAGPSEAAGGAVRALVTQLVSLHSPAELVVTAMVDKEWAAELESLVWLPHTESPQSPLTVPHLTVTDGSSPALLAALEEVALQRSIGQGDRGAALVESSSLEAGATVASHPDQVRTPGPVPAILLLISDHGANVDRARLVDLCERAADAGVYPIWISRKVEGLPAVARTYLDVSGSEASAGFVRLGQSVGPLDLESLDRATALRVARTLTPVTDANAHVNTEAGIPEVVSLVALHKPGLAHGQEQEFIVERWRTNDSIVDRSGADAVPHRAGDLRAIVGQTAQEAMRIDLRSQGPHALVGGTSGSGKSEFLQSWVLSLALEYSPDRVTFLLLDFKGGTAFGALEILPHTVGVVTDLGADQLDRVLVSLRAELQKREGVLAKAGAKDIRVMEERGDPLAPPALVIVVDEFAALATDNPEFVEGIVDIAQRGRALGVHLILATQRPSGVIKPSIRANTNLRIALRVADPEDSVDVIGQPIASTFDPDIHGRAIAKAGPGRLTTFQSAYVGGWTPDEEAAPVIRVSRLGFGVESPLHEATEVARVQAGEGPNDLHRLVSAIASSAGKALIPPIVRPWLEPLPKVIPFDSLVKSGGDGLVIGRVDLPAQQAQANLVFRPDTDGSIAFFGTGGSGKTVALRTLAFAAGEPGEDGPIHVYGIDYGAGGLRMLEPLPHVGTIVQADDEERTVRLLRFIRSELTRRARDYPTGRITDYRATNPGEPRILLVVDNFGAFAEELRKTATGADWYSVVTRVAGEGSGLGIHLALSADRPLALSGALTANIGQRIVLRLADGPYANEGPSQGAPAGRATAAGHEAQIAVVGDDLTSSGQSAELEIRARASTASRAPAILRMPDVITLSAIHDTDAAGFPAVGFREDTLEPLGIDPSGLLLIAGLDGSGRELAIETLAHAHHRADRDTSLYYLGPEDAELERWKGWTKTASDSVKIAALAREITAQINKKQSGHRVAVFVESAAEWFSDEPGQAILALVAAIKGGRHFLAAAAETGEWAVRTTFADPLRSNRRALFFQPTGTEGNVLNMTIPALTGRAVRGSATLAERNRLTRFQLAVTRELPDE